MRQYTILLVDYEPRSIERTRVPLVRAGYRVELATDGLSAIEAFHRIKPDLVLIEAMIPKKHGFEVCQELKRTPAGKKTPIVITTAVYRNRRYRTQALHIYGCDDYLEKPISEEALLEAVRRHLGEAEEPVARPSPAGAASPGENDPAELEIAARLDAIFSPGRPEAEEPAQLPEGARARPTKAEILAFDPNRARRARKTASRPVERAASEPQALSAGSAGALPALALDPRSDSPPLAQEAPGQKAASVEDLAGGSSGEGWVWAALLFFFLLGGWVLYGLLV
jgi:DNA-binding response OmpR family regulator